MTEKKSWTRKQVREVVEDALYRYTEWLVLRAEEGLLDMDVVEDRPHDLIDEFKSWSRGG